jgi:hypothetical protein
MSWELRKLELVAIYVAVNGSSWPSDVISLHVHICEMFLPVQLAAKEMSTEMFIENLIMHHVVRRDASPRLFTHGNSVVCTVLGWGGSSLSWDFITHFTIISWSIRDNLTHSGMPGIETRGVLHTGVTTLWKYWFLARLYLYLKRKKQKIHKNSSIVEVW